MLGWAILFRAPILFLYALFGGAVFDSYIRFLEEPALARKFGDVYDVNRRGVNRWLPRLRR